MSILNTALHVARSELARETLQEAFSLPPNNILTNSDSVAHGPAPLVHDLGEWMEVRSRYLQSLPFEFAYPPISEWGPDEILLNFHRLKEASEVVVWLGAGTEDHLFATWVVHFMHATDCDLQKVHFVTFSPRQSHWPILFAGELSVEATRARASLPQRPSADHLKEMLNAWVAYASTDPQELKSFIASCSGPLRDAVAPVLLRHPDPQTGLGFWDRLLLKNAKDFGPRLALAIGHSMLPDDPPGFLDSMGDGLLCARMLKMASPHARRPLVEVSGDRNDMRSCSVQLTEDGFAVLSGASNAIALNGIDDWIGGVHLTNA